MEVNVSTNIGYSASNYINLKSPSLNNDSGSKPVEKYESSNIMMDLKEVQEFLFLIIGSRGIEKAMASNTGSAVDMKA